MQIHPRLALGSAATALLLMTTACTAAATQNYELAPQSDSGVQGTLTLTELGSGRIRVEISVDDAGNPDMPAHIHAGTCDDMIPQPLFALVNVIDGESTTEVATSLDELLDGDVAVNVHQSNDAMEVSTACAELQASD